MNSRTHDPQPIPVTEALDSLRQVAQAASPDWSADDAQRSEAAVRRAEREAQDRYRNLVVNLIPPAFQSAKLDGADATDGKEAAVAAATEFAENGRVDDRSRLRYALFLTGSYGTGKTWLATAAFKRAAWRMVHGSVTNNGPFLWAKFYTFVRAVQTCYHSKAELTVEQVLGHYQKCPLLLLDDVGDLDVSVETEDRRRLLYEVLDYRSDLLLPTILTTNLTPDDMEAQFGGRTLQRVIEMAALVEMGGENYRMRS